MELRINQQYAKIGLDIQKPQLNLNTTLAAIELDIKKPQLYIESPRPVLHIDQSQCFADAGKRKPLDFSLYCSELARSDLAAGLDRRVEEGNILGEIENGGTIAQIAANSMVAEVDFNVTAIPKQRPEIWFDLSPVKTELERGRIDLQLRPGKFENNFQWGKVNTYLLQQNYLEISWHQGRFDKTI